MGRVLRRAWLPAGLAAVAAAAATVAAGNAPSAPAAPAANPTFTVVQSPASECAAPKQLVGRACFDPGGRILGANWAVHDGDATWNPPNAWTTTYKWTIPQTITPSGSAIKLEISALSTGTGLICPALGARGSFPLKDTTVDPTIGVCARVNEGKKDANKTFSVVAISGGPAYLLIGLQDGGSLSYKYVAKKPACRKFGSTAGTAIDPPFIVDFYATHLGVPPKGESPTLAGSATLISGKLSICDKLEVKGALASDSTGEMQHNDGYFYKGKKRIEKLKLEVVRGAYGRDARYEKVALVVEVTSSTDEQCPDGVQGRLTLTQDNKRTLEDVMWLRLCGQSHTHLFRGADRDVQVKVGITPRK